LALLLSGVESFQKQAAEQTRQHAHRQEETGAAGHPAVVIGGQAAAWHDAVQMRMVLEILPPGVQYGEEADLGAQVLGIACNGQQSISRGAEQDVINHCLVLVGNGSERLG
jgi:hypothetical protein